MKLSVPISSSGPHRPIPNSARHLGEHVGHWVHRGECAQIAPTWASRGRAVVQWLAGVRHHGPARDGTIREGTRDEDTSGGLPGLNEPWKTEEMEIDPPEQSEIRVKMACSGMCHSDEHLRTGDISAPPEVLEMMGVKSMFPIVGGHEGAGVVTEVGSNVTQVARAITSPSSFIPSCGTCHWCASGRQNLCDLGMARWPAG